MGGEQIWGIVRTILAGLGGFAVAKGYVDDGTLQSVLGGAGVVFVAIWSWVAKKNTPA
jgi:hypothetical protein